MGLKGGFNTYVYTANNSLSFLDINGLEIVGTWKVKPFPKNINIKISGFDFSWWSETITSFDYRATADIQFTIGCRDTCTGEQWDLDSGKRTISHSGSVNVEGGAPTQPCIWHSKRTKWACRILKFRKYQEWAETASRVTGSKITKLVYDHFDKIAAAYKKLIDPTTYCNNLPKP